MKKASHVLIFLVTLFCSVSMVFGAYTFDISVEPIINDIYVNESAVFKLTVNNSQSITDTFGINSGEVWWSIYTEPQSDYFGGITIGGGKSKSTMLLITPKKGLPGGKYAVELILESENKGSAIKKYLEVNVKSLKPPIPDYEPTIKLDLEVSNNAKFDPRNSATIKVILKNKNALTLSDIDITLKSSLIDKERSGITLEPLERRTEDFTISFKPNEEPQKDTLLVTVSAGNKTFVALKEFEILPYTLPFDQVVTVQKKFLKRIYQIKVTNPSNSYKSELVTYRAPLLKGMFSSSQPKGEIKRIDKKRYLTWDVGLSAQESKIFLVTYNYRPFFIVLCLIVLGVILYFVIRSPVEVKKRVSNIYTREGGISKLRLQISVKNRGSDPVHEVRIMDTIPSIGEVIREFQLGSLQPSKVIEREKKSTLIMWNIYGLEPNEERLISYDIKSKLTILGQLNLNPVIVKFKDKHGKEHSTSSNILAVNLRAKAQAL